MGRDVGSETREVKVSERPARSRRDLSPRLLLTNDDGVSAPGLRLLAEQLDSLYDVVVAAPARDMSGSGTGIGRFDAREGIELQRVGWNGIEAYTVDGPPGLAVMAAALGAFGAKPDVVVSGINAGVNTGHSVIHSGTVGAVLTARTFGSFGMAVSLAHSDPWQWGAAAEMAVGIIRWLLKQDHKEMVLNVNVPALPRDRLRGLKWAALDEFGVFRVATADYEGSRLQFQIGGADAGVDPASDTALCSEGFVTLTPLTTVEGAAFPAVPAESILADD